MSTLTQELTALIATAKGIAENSTTLSLVDKMGLLKALRSINTLALTIDGSQSPPFKVSHQKQPNSAVNDKQSDLPMRGDLAMMDSVTRKQVEVESKEIGDAIATIEAARQTLAKHIYNTDKKIITISAPARVGEKLTHKIDNRQGTAYGVISTNTEAYAITQSNQGIFAVTSVQQWASTNSIVPEKNL